MPHNAWWTQAMLDAWASSKDRGAMDMLFAQAVAREVARRTGRRQRVVVNRGHVYAGWRLAIIDAPVVGEPCS